MAEPRSDFWDSGLPFISDAENRRVDWTDVGLWSIGVVFTSIFSKIAETVATLWNVLVISPFERLSDQLSGIVGELFDTATTVLSFDSAIALAGDSGFIGSLLIVAAGGYLLAWVIGVILDG